MTIRSRIDRLESRQGHEQVFLAQPWLETGPATADNPPTAEQVAAHHAALRQVLKNPRAVVIDRAGNGDPWQVRPILDADRGRRVTIQRSYGQATENPGRK